MKSSTRLWVILGILAFLGIGLIGSVAAVVVALRMVKERDGVEVLAERDAERAEAAAAFKDPTPPTPEQEREFTAVLQSMIDRVRANPASAASAFDPEQTVIECERQGIKGRAGLRYRLRYSRQNETASVRAALPAMLAQFQAVWDWDTTKIVRVRLSEDGQEAVVIATHTDSTAESPQIEKYRWWFVRRPGGWKIYDLEELAVGMRISASIVAIISPEALANPARLQAAARNIRSAITAVSSFQTDDAVRHLIPVRGVALPPPLAAVRDLAEAVVAIQKGEFETALRHLDEVDRNLPDAPISRLLRASTLNQLARHDEALVTARQYLDMLGPDCNGYVAEGTALVGLNRNAEAEVSFGKALDDNPDDHDAFESLERVVSDERLPSLVTRVLRMRKPAEAFETLFSRLLYGDHPEKAEAVVSAYRKARPEDPAGLSAAARLAAKGGKIADGVAHLKEAIRKTDKPEDRSPLVRLFCGACPPERAKEVYEAVAAFDRRVAFRALVPVEWDDDDDFIIGPPHPRTVQAWAARDEVIAIHAAADGNDPRLDFVRGQLLQKKRDYAGADVYFSTAEKKLPPAKPKKPDAEPEYDGPESDRERIRSARLTAWYKLGKGLAALKEFGANTDTFTALAWQYDADKDADGLNRLLVAFAEAQPDDKDLNFWRGKVSYRMADYHGVVKRLQQHLDGIGPDEPRYGRYRYLAVDLLTRAFVRLSRPEEARRGLARYWPDGTNMTLNVLVAAAEGDPAAVEAALTALAGGRPNGADWLYADEDLGPLLRKPEFLSVREKFPDPEGKK